MRAPPKPAPASPLDQAATLQLLISLARTFKAIDDYVAPRLAPFQLSITEFAVLEVLHHKGKIPLGELAQRILVTGASTTYIVKKLEQRGLMRRRTSPEDRRVVLGELTPSGTRLMQRIFPLHVQHLQQAMGGLSTAEKRAATRLLQKLGRYARAEQERETLIPS